MIVVTPKFGHHLVEVNLELFGIDSGKLGQGESPTEESRTEGNSTLDWVYLLGVSHIFSFVGRDDNIGIFDDSLEVLIHGLSIDLEFEDTSIDLVDEEYWLNLLSQGLSEHSFGLHTDTFDVIDDDEGTISDSESGCDF